MPTRSSPPPSATARSVSYTHLEVYHRGKLLFCDLGQARAGLIGLIDDVRLQQNIGLGVFSPILLRRLGALGQLGYEVVKRPYLSVLPELAAPLEEHENENIPVLACKLEDLHGYGLAELDLVHLAPQLVERMIYTVCLLYTSIWKIINLIGVWIQSISLLMKS